MRIRQVPAAALLAFSLEYDAAAQAVNGGDVFRDRCAACHSGTSDSRAPAPDALRGRTPQAVIESLVTGAMRAQGSRMSGLERRAVAEFLTGTSLGGDVTGVQAGRCAAGGATPEPRPAGAWTGWSPDGRNTRYQTGAQAGLAAADVPRLTLKWAIGFPDASVAWAAPTVADGRLFVGSQNGTVYAIDARRGCVHWTFSAAGGVRTAVAVGAGLVYFADTAATAYALEAATGAVKWTRRVDEHPLARITGSPTLHDGRLYVPVSSYEEAQGADPQYPCCTFRGSVSALDAATGRVIWKTYTISDEPARRGTSTAGIPLWGPAGAAIWSAPTVDGERRRLYVATGNMYSGPSRPASNAVVALDLETGAIRWMRQVTPDDVYLTGCRAGNPNCPEKVGPDVDFGSPPMLARLAGGRSLIVIGQKSGFAYAMDPGQDGRIVWQYRAGQGGVLGGLEWGGAVDAERAYFAVSDMTHPKPGGLHAVNLSTGDAAWVTEPPAPVCAAGRGCNAAQSAAVTVIPGVVFSASNDGAVRGFSTATGEIVWQFDTNREFATVNGVRGRGGSIQGPGPVVAGGFVYVNSGYGAFGGRPGNVLLAFGLE